MAQYGAIRRVQQGGTVGWVFTPPSGQEVSDGNFVHLLNGLANQGWRVVAAGDFRDSPGDELILEKA